MHAQYSECKTADYFTIHYQIKNSDNGTAGALCMVNNGWLEDFTSSLKLGGDLRTPIVYLWRKCCCCMKGNRRKASKYRWIAFVHSFHRSRTASHVLIWNISSVMFTWEKKVVIKTAFGSSSLMRMTLQKQCEWTQAQLEKSRTFTERWMQVFPDWHSLHSNTCILWNLFIHFVGIMHNGWENRSLRGWERASLGRHCDPQSGVRVMTVRIKAHQGERLHQPMMTGRDVRFACDCSPSAGDGLHWLCIELNQAFLAWLSCDCAYHIVPEKFENSAGSSVRLVLVWKSLAKTHENLEPKAKTNNCVRTILIFEAFVPHVGCFRTCDQASRIKSMVSCNGLWLKAPVYWQIPAGTCAFQCAWGQHDLTTGKTTSPIWAESASAQSYPKLLPATQFLLSLFLF